MLKVAGVKKLNAKTIESDANLKYHVTAENLYDVIKTVHKACDQGGRDHIAKKVALK